MEVEREVVDSLFSMAVERVVVDSPWRWNGWWWILIKNKKPTTR